MNGLSKYYCSVGIDVSSDEIVVTTGGSEALVLGLCRAWIQV